MNTINLNKQLMKSEFSGIARVISQADQAGKDVIRLEVGDIDLETSTYVLEGIEAAMAARELHYPPLRGNPKLLDKIIDMLVMEDIHVSHNQLLITAGGSMGMYIALHTVVNYGDEVLIFEPVWPHLIQMITLSGAIPVKIPLDEELNFHMDISVLDQYLTKKTKAIIINTPNNPTGVVYSAEEIELLCQFAENNNLIIISDEEYNNFVYGNNKVTSPIKYYENVIISRSFSKTFAASGLRLGYLIFPEAWSEAVSKISLFSSMYPSSISQLAILRALEENDPYPDSLRNIFERRLDLVVNALNNIEGLSCRRSEGAVYVWVKFEGFSTDDITICDKILAEAKVSLVPGSYFGSAGQGFARLSLGQKTTDLEVAIERIKDCMKN